MKNLLFFLCAYATINSDSVVSMRIIKTQMNTETITNVNCDNFTRVFQMDLDTFYINSKQQERIIYLLSRTSERKGNFDVDTRGTIQIIYASKHIDNICLDYTGVISINNTIKIDTKRDLINMIDSMTKNH